MTAATFGIYDIYTLILGLVMGAGMNGHEVKYLSGYLLVWTLKSLGYATFAMIVLYWTKNVVLATFTDVLFLFIGDTLITTLDHIPVIKFYHLQNYIFEGILTKANVSLQLGQAGAWLWIIFSIVRICAFSILVSFLLFRKKELDF